MWERARRALARLWVSRLVISWTSAVTSWPLATIVLYITAVATLAIMDGVDGADLVDPASCVSTGLCETVVQEDPWLGYWQMLASCVPTGRH